MNLPEDVGSGHHEKEEKTSAASLGGRVVEIMQETREQMFDHAARFSPFVIKTEDDPPPDWEIAQEYINENLAELLTAEVQEIYSEIQKKVEKWPKNKLMRTIFLGMEDEYYEQQDKRVSEFLEGLWVKASSINEDNILKSHKFIGAPELPLRGEAEGKFKFASSAAGSISLKEADDIFWHVPIIDMDTGEQEATIEAGGEVIQLS